MITHKTFNAISDIKAYLNDLVAAGRFYHLDDDPENILWAQDMPAQELAAIDANHQRLYAYCDEQGLDPWRYVPDSAFKAIQV